jgi:UDP-glucose 6-dehydrogenase
MLLARSTMRIMGPKYMTAGMGDAGACHPRDNIALRWLAEEYDIGYDLFDTVMHAREVQAKNLALFLVEQAKKYNLPVVIHGKAYKPDVEYCIGSYSTLVGFYIKEAGLPVVYVDPLADNQDEVVDLWIILRYSCGHTIARSLTNTLVIHPTHCHTAQFCQDRLWLIHGAKWLTCPRYKCSTLW